MLESTLPSVRRHTGPHQLSLISILRRDKAPTMEKGSYFTERRSLVRPRLPPQQTKFPIAADSKDDLDWTHRQIYQEANVA